MNMGPWEIFSVFILPIIGLGIFFILRGFFLWYWKVNDVISEFRTTTKNLKEMNESIKMIATKLGD